jgi:rhamnulokinase
MNLKSSVLAVDLGAESGRVIAAGFDGQQLSLEVVHRFVNQPVHAGGTLYWDVLRLWQDIQDGLRAGMEHNPAALGLDTWGVDFALLDDQGKLLGNPVHYRDGSRLGHLPSAFGRVSREEIYATTGVQFMEINGLYHLVGMREGNDPQLQTAATLLTIPDLFNFFLTGEKVCEFTNATTLQAYDPNQQGWAEGMLRKLGIPVEIFPQIVKPGTRLGFYDRVPVIAPACHDTGSAVVSVPADTKNFAYISSGTWSLLGLELAKPIITAEALEANLTNEGGFGNTYRFLKNIMGLWIIQQCRLAWAADGMKYDYTALTQMAAQAPAFGALIDPDDPSFLLPGDMPARIAAYCIRTHQAVPEGVAAITRCVLESLALKYRHVLDLVMKVSGQPVDVLHILGGGAQNNLLCQMTADAIQRPVVAGPVEATALGNALVQWISLGELGSIDEARSLVRNSFKPDEYLPKDREPWDEAYQRMQALIGTNDEF